MLIDGHGFCLPHTGKTVKEYWKVNRPVDGPLNGPFNITYPLTDLSTDLSIHGRLAAFGSESQFDFCRRAWDVLPALPPDWKTDAGTETRPAGRIPEAFQTILMIWSPGPRWSAVKLRNADFPFTQEEYWKDTKIVTDIC